MPEIDPLSERIGLLTASVDNLGKEQKEVSKKLDLIMANYASAKDVKSLGERVDRIEHSLTESRTRRKLLWSIGTVIGTVIGGFLAIVGGAYHDWFGH